MANSINAKEEVVVNKESKVEKIIVLYNPDSCQVLAMEMTDEVSFTDDVMIHGYYQSWLELCYSFNF